MKYSHQTITETINQIITVADKLKNDEKEQSDFAKTEVESLCGKLYTEFLALRSDWWFKSISPERYECHLQPFLELINYQFLPEQNLLFRWEILKELKTQDLI
jgi:hypothetical protein